MRLQGRAQTWPSSRLTCPGSASVRLKYLEPQNKQIRSMRLLGAPRQPFVGLAGAAAIGIILAELFPLSVFTLTVSAIFIAVCAVALFFWPRLVVTYLIVGSGFFLLH